ncbi:MAG: hypothetical protein APF80_15265 [Alphaproteobacteria bacterium BRH_c36]|nr:MAG: hypothetical protein APF80_15265 [Alphaproteobacteria bacterium BRH_c36]
MDTRHYLTRILSLAAAVILLALALHLGGGPRWFGFYGPATLTLTTIPFLGWILFRRYRKLSLSRWPIVAALLPAAIAALVQIGFWLAFFTSGPDGITLAVGRSMVLPIIAPALPILIAIMAAVTAWLVVRGAMKRSS